MKLILASTSPRRKALLEDAGIDFKTASPTFDESTLRLSSPEIYVMQLSYQKAMSVQRGEEDVILASDTVVVLGDKILGKPESRQDAERMLNSLKGKEHHVLTGYAILGKEKYVDYDVAIVSFEEFTEEQLKAYLDKNTFGDKAGAYGFQEVDSFKITIDGDPNTVIGLPVTKVIEHLKGESIGK